MDRRGWLRFDLLSQLVDDHAQVVHLVAVVGPPDRLQQFPVRQHLVGVRHHVSQQFEFLRRQPHAPAAGDDLTGVEVDLDAAQDEAPVGPCVDGVRRSAARIRASNSEELKGLVT